MTALPVYGASVELFSERAAGVTASWKFDSHNSDAVRTICRAVEGLPLAIEIAAAQLRWLTERQSSSASPRTSRCCTARRTPPSARVGGCGHDRLVHCPQHTHRGRALRAKEPANTEMRRSRRASPSDSRRLAQSIVSHSRPRGPMAGFGVPCTA